MYGNNLTDPFQNNNGNPPANGRVPIVYPNGSMLPSQPPQQYISSAAPLPFAPQKFSLEQARLMDKILKYRKITYLTHFTRLENLASILRRGLFSRGALLNNPETANVRLNSEPLPLEWQFALSLNISFPDYKLFYKFQERMGYEWVVLIFDARILLEQSFYYFNRRAGEMIFSPGFNEQVSPYLQTPETFGILFQDFGDIKRTEMNIPLNYPTNPQSEILTFAPVGMRWLREVHFYNDYKLKQWWLQNMDLALSLDKRLWKAEMTYFSPRCDYTFWKTDRQRR